MSREELISASWLFVSGAVIALLRSVVDGTRRSFVRLLVGCLFGGLGAYMAGFAFEGRWFAPFAIGAAAVMTEHLALGLYRLAVAFSNDPVAMVERFWKVGSALHTVIAALAAGPKGDEKKKDE